MSGKDSMDTLPPGWHLARFDEFLQRIERKFIIDNSTNYSTVGVRWYGQGTFVRETLLGMNISRKQQWIIKSGDIVYNKLFAWKGAFAIADESVDSCIVSDKFPTYKAKTEIIDLRFLRYYFFTSELAQKAQDLSKGAAAISKLTLNPPQFWDLTLPLPPIEEQRRIVARIEELAAKIEEARELRRRAVEEANALLKSGMKDIFTFPNLELQPVRQLVTLKGGGTPSKSNPYYWEGSIPWISPKDMKSKEITDSLDHISEIATEESAAKLLHPGAVLIVVRGMILTKIVPSAILKVPAAINQDMKALIPSKELMPEYLCGALWAFNNQILELVEKSTHDTRKLETAKLLDFRIPVPSIDQQRIVVTRLSDLQAKLDALQRHQAETTAELDALRPAVLERAFRGEL